MERLLWSMALVVTFLLGLAVNVAGTGRSAVQEVDQLRATASHLQRQVANLQARLRAREPEVGAEQERATDSKASAPQASDSGVENRPIGRRATPGMAEDGVPGPGARPARGPGGMPADRTAALDGARGKASPAPTLEAALDRFYRYLDATNGSEWGDRRPRARELMAELRAMGDVGAQALLQVLATGSDSEERRTAARLLGMLQVPEGLPLLYDVLHTSDDMLLRRAAASALGQLQTPESIPVMQALLANPGEDRFVRMSAAYGLAQAGHTQGSAALVQIFEESSADGRGRELAFRSIASVSDGLSLTFMRQVLTSQVEPTYRLRAIRYLTAQGDRQSLWALQQIMLSPTEQPSIRDAAAQASRSIASR